jgi:chromosome segregation ATPase
MKFYIFVDIIFLFDFIFAYSSIMAEIKTTQKRLEEIFDKKLNPLNSKIADLNSTVQELMNTISFISKKYDEINEKVVKMEGEKREIIDKNKRTKSEIFNMSNELKESFKSRCQQNSYNRRQHTENFQRYRSCYHCGSLNPLRFYP